MKPYIFDIEADGFTPTKIHCMGVSTSTKSGVTSSTSYNRMRRLVTRKDVVLVAHNCVQYDIPVMKRLLDVDIVCKVADTLAISWYLYPKRAKHGLGDWGEEFGIPKPVVEDWDNQPIEVYLHRVEEDVKINTMLWEKMLKD